MTIKTDRLKYFTNRNNHDNKDSSPHFLEKLKAIKIIIIFFSSHILSFEEKMLIIKNFRHKGSNIT
jgi:hypothetical protein